jgi:CubicO group peptidase (beta-lactamase class C family)
MVGALASIESDVREAVLRESEALALPGAVVALRLGDEILEVATGVTSLRTDVPMTPDTLFLIGSISKTYTATLVMCLIDQGLVELDEPVKTYLPGLRLGNEEATETITVRQLLCHTSGLDENIDLYPGRDDECIARFVDACRTLPQVHPPGALFSYCNSGMVIAGRLAEVLTGQFFDEALRVMLFDPLGLHATVTLPEEAILFRAAVGHFQTDTGGFVATSTWTLPRALGPAGSTICASARDLLAFGSLQFADNPKQIVSAELLAEMRVPQVRLPDPTAGDASGLGWRLVTVGSEPALTHFGGNIGQLCQVFIFPQFDFGLAILVNSFGSMGFHDRIVRTVASLALGLTDKDREKMGSSPVEHGDRYVGRYANGSTEWVVEFHDSKVWVKPNPRDPWARSYYANSTGNEVSLERLFDQTFASPLSSVYGERDLRIVFLQQDDAGRPRYLHTRALGGDFTYSRQPELVAGRRVS